MVSAQFRQHESTPAAAAASLRAAGADTTFASAVYEGWVRHRRYSPHPHAFRYKMAMLYIDLAEVEQLFARRWFWSVDKTNIAQFRRADFLGDANVPLDEAVRRRVEQHNGRKPVGPIRMLSHLRYAGVGFNPVTFYYCFASDGTTLETVVAEITNTPWKERFAYVLDVVEADVHGTAFGWRFDKLFHVSPFMPMNRRYDWRFTVPGDELRVHMEVLNAEGRNFDATLVLHRRPLTGANLARVLWRFPLMTMKVIAAIHYEAVRLFLKRNPVHDHPNKHR